MGKTALVLSAGGMFGAYQAGAFRAIVEREPPDIIVGASVGALNGWSIAGGCSADGLIQRWLDPATGDALRLVPNHGFRNGWLDPVPLRAQAERLWHESRPRIPFGLVMVELRTLKSRLIQHPHITPDHLQATCSIPLFLPMVRIGGRRYLDGGVFEKLPVWAALEMGATRIIAVDSMPRIGNAVDTMTRAGRWCLHRAIDVAHALKPVRRYPEELDLTIVSPSGTLGDANDAVFWKRENIERWVDMGMRDAAAALAQDDRGTEIKSLRCHLSPGHNPGG